jgi:hypothetical protein
MPSRFGAYVTQRMPEPIAHRSTFDPRERA